MGTSDASAARESWSLPKRVAFRFAFVYLVVYAARGVLSLLPMGEWIGGVHERLWEAIVPWFGKHVLHLSQDIEIHPTGSGDTLFNYVQFAVYVALAAAATSVWSLVDARRKEYEGLLAFLRVYLRYCLASAMLSYGLSKVIKTQFLFPDPGRLLQPLGNMSPMGLVWAFMGYSTAYTFFAGAGEVVGGMLLFFRRTTTLGALVIIGVMSNVVMLNFCYDVPVKLFSSHLLLMAVILVLPDMKRLANLLVLNRPAAPAAERAPLRARWMERVRIPLKVLLIGYTLISMTMSELEFYREIGDNAPRSASYGLYEVEAFTRNGEAAPPLLTDATRWRRLSFNRHDMMVVHLMNDERRPFLVKDDPAKQSFTLVDARDESKSTVITYAKPDPDHLVIEGTIMNEALNVRLRRVDLSSFTLVNRGFHWINEYPYNR